MRNEAIPSTFRLVTNEQLYIALGIPMLFNAALFGFVIAYINARFDKQGAKYDSRFEMIERRFDAMDKRFDDMRDLWRAELRRLEEVLDARLKHLEERG
jgi:hypothetical protein